MKRMGWAALFLAYVLGPSLIFAVTGWVSARPVPGHARGVHRLFRLVIVTTLFYLVAAAISGNSG